MTFQRFQIIAMFLLLGLAAAGAVSLGVFGLQLGIDFTGGSLLEAEYAFSRPTVAEIRESLQGLAVGSPTVQPIGERGVLLRMKDIDEPLHQEVLSALGTEAEELRFESIGPVIGRELRERTILLSLFAVLAVVLYIAFAFRQTAEGIRPWHWSGAALVASLHDMLIPLGIFALLGTLLQVQFTIPVVVALLTVVGYSINDTVVVFDRMRENLRQHTGFDLADTVKQSLRQTWVRSLSTSLTTLAVLFSIYLFGGSTLQHFSLMLILGIVAGTLSSLFLAPSLLLLWRGAFVKR